MQHQLFKIAAILVFSSVMFGACTDNSVDPNDDYSAGLPPMPAAPEMKGYSYVSFAKDGFKNGEALGTLEDLKEQTASDYVAICVFEFQSTDTSADIAPNTTGRNPVTTEGWSTTSTIEDIRTGIRHARKNGMKVVLKPHVDIYKGGWRAAIKPDSAGKWFESYTAMILKYAKLAQEENVEMVCIGVELLTATQAKYQPQWREMIGKIRSVYSGKLTYAANWSGMPIWGIPQDEYKQVKFWDLLDYIGIDAYYPMASVFNSTPSFTSAVKRMKGYAEQARQVGEFYNKKVILMELGIQSVKGALTQPFEHAPGAKAGAIPDYEIQEFYYRVMIEAFGTRPWCAGMFWWNWDSYKNPTQATNYTVKDKPAAKVLKEWYSKIVM
jgi:predicted enzyme related to lactoylglutathione lyase